MRFLSNQHLQQTYRTSLQALVDDAGSGRRLLVVGTVNGVVVDGGGPGFLGTRAQLAGNERRRQSSYSRLKSSIKPYPALGLLHVSYTPHGVENIRGMQCRVDLSLRTFPGFPGKPMKPDQRRGLCLRGERYNARGLALEGFASLAIVVSHALVLTVAITATGSATHTLLRRLPRSFDTVAEAPVPRARCEELSKVTKYASVETIPGILGSS